MVIFIETYTHTKQLIIVSAHKNKCIINCFEKSFSNKWKNIFSDIHGYVGQNGISKNKIEGDMKTPVGFYPIDFAFGIKYIQLNNFFFRPVTPYSYWISNPNLINYNKWSESQTKIPEKDAEHLIDFRSEYKIALSVGYNKNPVTFGKGSAIFIHCGNKPTAGCIALDEACLLNIIYWLDYKKFPYIYIHDMDTDHETIYKSNNIFKKLL